MELAAMYQELKRNLFSIRTDNEFARAAIAIFRIQFEHNAVYNSYCSALGKTPETVEKIPFLPIAFFKSKEVVTVLSQASGESVGKNAAVFYSSATTSATPSRHKVTDTSIYQESFRKCFSQFYGNIGEYCLLALLPSYLERSGSSLVYMAEDMVRQSAHLDSGFYLHNFSKLKNVLLSLEESGQKTLLLGVTYALLAFAEQYPISLKHTIVMETGGMKGMRAEMPRKEVHSLLQNAFGTASIHSEYGMTELLSQCYSKGKGIFRSPPWMRIVVRDRRDPLHIGAVEQSGGINIIDLANINSCSFIATDDAGIMHRDGSFEITGRLDASEIRGCNLMFNE